MIVDEIKVDDNQIENEDNASVKKSIHQEDLPADKEPETQPLNINANPSVPDEATTILLSAPDQNGLRTVISESGDKQINQDIDQPNPIEKNDEDPID